LKLASTLGSGLAIAKTPKITEVQTPSTTQNGQHLLK
jgi:hypothetical protein